MTSNLLDRLQAALGRTYRIERELGGGGMSRVFLADDVELGRRVVVKVLPADMAVGANGDRFRREVQVAARLQHPHIVPLLAAGSADDLLYYVMPFIEGETLREKLSREGELPIATAVSVFCEVVDALMYAHEHGIVHRDIKPDNVLLSGRHAVVTDFGVAKAVSEAKADSLTTMGVALGTPAYMAPEQAVADPNVDHRADLYAAGAMAYEMLTGRPPFAGPNIQAVLAAQVTERPQPIARLRSSVPTELEAIVMRCLEKKPADRWQRADELLPHLNAIAGQTAIMTPHAAPPVSSGTRAAIQRAHPLRVAALFAAAAVALLAVTYGVVLALGLPDWVFAGAVLVLAAGLPVMLLTGHHERRRATRSAVEPDGTDGFAGFLTWRRAFAGGAIAFATLCALAFGFVGLRALGIGPFGTLLTTGVLEQRDRIILADFENITDDPRMGETVTALLRTDLSQSRVISLLEPGQVGDVLERMQRSRTEPLTPELVAQVAAREGIKAYVGGEVRQVGNGYVLVARLVAATGGDALVNHRETAADASDLIRATERLSAHLRERVGESLRSVRASPALERVTTASLDALRLYAQAERTADRGDLDGAIRLLEQAVAIDSGFAAAHRRLSAFYGNVGNRVKADSAIARAFTLRDRLSERERYLVDAMHAHRIEKDNEKAIGSYLALLDRYPLDRTALNNVAVMYGLVFREDEGAKWYRRAIEQDIAPGLSYTNLILNRIGAGQVEVADTILQLFAERYPDNEQVPEFRARLALARRDFDNAETTLRMMLGSSPARQQFAYVLLSEIAETRGRVSDAMRLQQQSRRIQADRFDMSADELDFMVAKDRLFIEVSAAIDRTALADRVEALWNRHVGEQPADNREYNDFIMMFARTGRVERARELRDLQRAGTSAGALDRIARFEAELLDGDIAAAEGRYNDRLAHIRVACGSYRPTGMAICDAAPVTADAYDRIGQADSAMAIYERYIAFQGDPQELDMEWLARSLRRLAELHEERGNREAAADYYARFVELWQDADEQFQPLVRNARDRLIALTSEQRR